MSDDVIDKAVRDAAQWALRIRETLGGLLEGRVHFRPSSGGVSMIGLDPNAPQQGTKQYRDLQPLLTQFDDIYARDCLVRPGRDVPEKHLQSYLIGEALRSDRVMLSLNRATGHTFRFITDELGLVLPDGKIVCDLLAVRVDGGRCTPVLIELKSAREKKRLVEQVTAYASIVDRHREAFSLLFGAVLGTEVKLAGATEKWIVWPEREDGTEPHAEPLGAVEIGVVTFRRDRESYTFVGHSCRDAIV